MSNHTAPLSTDRIEEMRQRYTPEPVPTCSVCGAALSIQSAGGGNATVYGCESHKPFDWKHYERSRWTQYRPGDQDVLDLITAWNHRAATSGAGVGVEAVLEAIEANTIGGTEDHPAINFAGLIGDLRSAAPVPPTPVDAEIERYIARCREMGDAGDGKRYAWWDRLAEILSRTQPSPAKEVGEARDEWLRDTAMNVMLAQEVEEATRVLRAALEALPSGGSK